MDKKINHIKHYPQFNIQTLHTLVIDDIVKMMVELSKTQKVSILELGTRRSNVDCPTNKKHLFSEIEDLNYVMTDYQAGMDVDVICDLHHTSKVFDDESFDLIISCSTYEHLKYPQVCSLNLMKMLKKNGIIFIQTHQTYPLHGYKFDYFRFSREALESLFPPTMNMKTLSSYFTHICDIITPKPIPGWNSVSESYLNVVHVSQKIDVTPDVFVYDFE